ncbi:MAG: N-acetylornithine carbamoyltransferase [Planctomycetes bacterium]|nr:N-acetylornithine carbamoyltransferase [Planctomycetota bacterium]
MTKRDVLTAATFSAGELENLIELTERMKEMRSGQVLAGRTVALLFFDRSLRTRVSFECATVQLGGHCLNLFAENELYGLEPEDRVVMDGSAEEHVKDAARTLSRYVDALGVRALDRSRSWEVDRQERLLHAYAKYATVPVINLESTLEHPCQAIADIVTIKQNLIDLKGRKLTLAWTDHPDPKGLGPCHSLLHVATMLGMDVTLAHPLGFELDEETVGQARTNAADSGGGLRIVNDLESGLDGAEVLYARAWGSTKYWSDPEREAMVKRSLHSWRIDEAAMARTANALFMHPLPVRRNVVATDSVLDGPRSVIYDQAENRLHVQKALLTHLLG